MLVYGSMGVRVCIVLNNPQTEECEYEIVCCAEQEISDMGLD